MNDERQCEYQVQVVDSLSSILARLEREREVGQFEVVLPSGQLMREVVSQDPSTTLAEFAFSQCS